MAELKMPNINKIIITGRLTRDPDVRFTKSNQVVVNFDIANNHAYKDGATNEWKKLTTFVRVTLYGNLGDRVKEKLHKGTPVFVEGRFQEETWTTSDNQQRKAYKIIGSKIQILEKSVEYADAVIEKDEEVPENEPQKKIKDSEELDDLPF
ncbi:MAG: single-stranded DNA-binding protein [Proteobacteria bacterium]|nr:single-stranded DNA-binding protein [Pseudomonadota bacterium]